MEAEFLVSVPGSGAELKRKRETAKWPPRAVMAQFIGSAARPEQFPAEGLPEVAFLGRSNVGKSTLLNSLTGRPGLAFTSARPGCTQLINFYRVEGRVQFVDLPGYGFAKVPIDIRERWKDLVEHYLAQRKSLELSFLVLDSRRGWTENDLELKRWLVFHNRRYRVIATKTDKLKTQKEQYHGIAAIRAHALDEPLLLFSAETGRGAREIWQAIWKIKDKL